jgi:cytosine deaminase
VDIQIVAFPQHGVVVKPGTIELMEAAIGMGADVVGGLDPASFDGDVEGQLRLVYGVAERTGAPLDIHLHDGGQLGAFELGRIAAWTRSLGMEGRVVVSHAYALGQIDDAAMRRLAGELARAGIAIMTNAPGDHGFPPVLPLRAEGVEVFAGTDNVRDAWWPYGDADMLHRAEVIGYRSGFYADEDLVTAFDLVTGAGRRALGWPNVEVAVGSPADLIAIEARHVPEAVVTYPVRRYVWKAGMLVARGGRLLGAGQAG